MRAVIIDDEWHVRETMAELIGRHCRDVDLVGGAESVALGIDLIRESNPDIVFLDIEMPGRNGFELLAAFTPIPFKVIFVTAYDRYAIRAIKLSALDYLLKPVDPLELMAAVHKAATAGPGDVTRAQIELVTAIDAPHVPSKVAIPTDEGYVFIAIDDIIRCRSESNYTRLYLADGAQLLSSRTLGDYEELLRDAKFFRVHHSHLINMSHALRYRRGRGGVVVMSDGSEVEVSTRRRDAFLLNIRTI